MKKSPPPRNKVKVSKPKEAAHIAKAEDLEAIDGGSTSEDTDKYISDTNYTDLILQLLRILPVGSLNIAMNRLDQGRLIIFNRYLFYRH